MVMDNICHLLNNFLRCSQLESVIFCWVLDVQSTLDEILARLDTAGCTVKAVSLICDEAVLLQRLQRMWTRGCGAGYSRKSPCTPDQV